MERDRLIVGHRALARRIAREHLGRGVDGDDLVGEAELALCRAAGDFDPARFPGVTFAAFAATYIKRAVAEAIERNDAVRLPRAVKRAVLRCKVATEALRSTGLARPSAEDVAAASGLSLAEVLEAQRVRESATPIELFGAPDVADPDQARQLEVVEDVLDECSELGRQVLTLVGVDGLTIAQAARRLVRPIRDVQRAHDEAALCVAEAMRRRGWTERAWASAIA
jgi:RNA polymerase sigma factor (sigma-70 family)